MDSDFEIFSLKDSVWKLNTRVLVLESFITQRYGTNVLRDVVKNDSKSNTDSSPARSQGKNSGENKRQSHEQCSSSKKEKDYITKKINTGIPSPLNNQKKRPKRVDYDEDNENLSENSSDNDNDQKDLSSPRSKRRTSTSKKIKYNEVEESVESCPDNENSDSEYTFGLLEPKSEISDEVQNDTETEIEDIRIQPEPVNKYEKIDKVGSSSFESRNKGLKYQRHKKGIKIKTGTPTGPKLVTTKKTYSVPTFSPSVARIITSNEGDITSVWKQLIEESASFYFVLDLGHGSEYKNVGVAMLGAYPKIAREGKHPWSKFCKALSGKIRKMRMDGPIEEAKLKKIEPVNVNTTIPTIIISNTRLYRKDVEERPGCSSITAKSDLVIELAKSKPCKTKIKSLLEQTFNLRTQLIKNKVTPNALFDSYPCLAEAKYIEHEAQLRLGEENFCAFKANFSLLISAMLRVGKCEELSSALKSVLDKFCKPPFFVNFCQDDVSYQTIIRSTTNSMPLIIVREERNDNLFVTSHVSLVLYNKVISGIESLDHALEILILLRLALNINYRKSVESFMFLLEDFLIGSEVKSCTNAQKVYLKSLKTS